MIRYLPSAAYGLVLVCYFLPFVSVSCGGSRKTASAVEILMQAEKDARKPAKKTPSDAKESKDPNLEPWLLISALAAIIAVALSASGRHTSAALLGLAAAACLIGFRLHLDAVVRKAGIDVSYEVGYWGATFFGLAGGVGDLLLMHSDQLFLEANRRKRMAAVPCPGCGKALPPGDGAKFCKECGRALL